MTAQRFNPACSGNTQVLAHVLFFLSGFMPRNRRKVVFGAWLGWRFADNSKYLLLHLSRTTTGLDLVWIGSDTAGAAIPRDLPVRFVRRGSWAAVVETLTAGTCFVTHAMQDLGRFNLMRGARRIYLGHGLALKHMGSPDRPAGNPIRAALRRLWRQTYRYDGYACCSPLHREKLLVENATNAIVPAEIIESGQPRVDFLLENANPARQAAHRKALLAGRGVPPARRVIAYLPTFRNNGFQAAFSFADLGGEQRTRMEALLERLDAVLVEKSHVGAIQSAAARRRDVSRRLLVLSGDTGVDTQELLLATDLLVTDYSGCYVDFLVLNRPILHFAYDRERYENADRGLHFELEEVAGGPIVTDIEGLWHHIEGVLTGAMDFSAQQARARAMLTTFERGSACALIAGTLGPAAAARHSESWSTAST